MENTETKKRLTADDFHQDVLDLFDSLVHSKTPRAPRQDFPGAQKLRR